eukprot:gene27082-53461_t
MSGLSACLSTEDERAKREAKASVWDACALPPGGATNHAIDKAMRFLWQKQDELFPESFVSITQEEWLNRWARELRAEWVLNWGRLHQGEEPQQYTFWPKGVEGLDVQRKFERDSVSIWAEVFTMLDITKNGAVDKGELCGFFGSKQLGPDADPMGTSACAPAASSAEGPGETLTSNARANTAELFLQLASGAEGRKMAAVSMESSRRLTARFAKIRAELYKDQCKACHLAMTDRQVRRFIAALGPNKLCLSDETRGELQRRSDADCATPAADAADSPHSRRSVGGLDCTRIGWKHSQEDLRLAVSFLLRGETETLDFGLDESQLGCR